jgi:hypothetical protein
MRLKALGAAANRRGARRLGSRAGSHAIYAEAGEAVAGCDLLGRDAAVQEPVEGLVGKGVHLRRRSIRQQRQQRNDFR